VVYVILSHPTIEFWFIALNIYLASDLFTGVNISDKYLWKATKFSEIIDIAPSLAENIVVRR
jgi:hypothetical protein